ncbi:hypothetical protein [Halomicrobium urmianum]|uniref:hypothetical protein n=1 Tax=Halomicrobium urmianum TaxID=1586233 RepID=UPI001CD9E69C|nr:hypothetical protein [Halomicrobium urmianum]
MNRRKLLIAGGGTVGALVGGTAVASATRADILADDELTQGEGESEEMENNITRESVEYLESTNEVRENGHAQSFKKWARRESAEIGASEVVSVAENRLDKQLEGVGSGVRYLIFGPVITVDHYVTRDRDGSIESEPNVTLEQLISVTPQKMTITVTVDGHTFTKGIPVGVGHSDVYQG